MKFDLKPGQLAVVRGMPWSKVNNRFVVCVRIICEAEPVSGFRWRNSHPGEPSWLIKSAGPGLLPWGDDMVKERAIGARRLHPINGDQPGNESWFTAAPRSKPATTKQDTIDARGMVQS